MFKPVDQRWVGTTKILKTRHFVSCLECRYFISIYVSLTGDFRRSDGVAKMESFPYILGWIVGAGCRYHCNLHFFPTFTNLLSKCLMQMTIFTIHKIYPFTSNVMVFWKQKWWDFLASNITTCTICNNTFVDHQNAVILQIEMEKEFIPIYNKKY